MILKKGTKRNKNSNNKTLYNLITIPTRKWTKATYISPIKTEIIHLIRSDEDPGRLSKRPVHDQVINRRQGHQGALRQGESRC